MFVLVLGLGSVLFLLYNVLCVVLVCGVFLCLFFICCVSNGLVIFVVICCLVLLWYWC